MIKIEDHDARKRNEIVGLLIPKSIVSGNVFIALPILKKYVHAIEIVGLLIPKSIVSRSALHMLLIPKSIVKKSVNAAIYDPQPHPCLKPAQP